MKKPMSLYKYFYIHKFKDLLSIPFSLPTFHPQLNVKGLSYRKYERKRDQGEWVFITLHTCKYST